MGVSGRNHGTYGSQPCGLWVLSVVVAIAGLGGYTYIYVGDMNPSRKIRCVNPPRGRDAPRHVSTSGTYCRGTYCRVGVGDAPRHVCTSELGMKPSGIYILYM